MKRFVFPRWDELPAMDLYMDQVLTYINDVLGCTYFNDEKFITNSMINNYVKAGLVNRPIKKHYTKNHIAYFLAVTVLKRCYSLTQIDAMIRIQTHMDNSSVSTAYDVFIQRFEDSLNAVFDENSEEPDFHITKEEQALMDHVVQCVVYKIHTEYVLRKDYGDYGA